MADPAREGGRIEFRPGPASNNAMRGPAARRRGRGGRSCSWADSSDQRARLQVRLSPSNRNASADRCTSQFEGQQRTLVRTSSGAPRRLGLRAGKAASCRSRIQEGPNVTACSEPRRPPWPGDEHAAGGSLGSHGSDWTCRPDAPRKRRSANRTLRRFASYGRQAGCFDAPPPSSSGSGLRILQVPAGAPRHSARTRLVVRRSRMCFGTSAV